MLKNLPGMPDSYEPVLKLSNSPIKKINYKKLFKNAGDCKAEMLHGFHNGKKHGLTTHCEELDKMFCWMPGFLYCITGWPQMGKSEVILFLSMLRAKKSGDRFLVFSPESGSAGEYFDQLVHSYLGQNTDPYYTNQVSEKEYIRGIDFVNEHYTIIDRKELSKQGLLPSPDFLREVTQYKYAEKSFFAVIKDPWNQLSHNYTNRDDLYLGTHLPQEKELAETLDICNIILAHPKGLTDKYDPKKGLHIPTWRDIAGGPRWNDGCDVIGAVHRPGYHLDPLDREAIFVTQKFKRQRYTAYPGSQIMFFYPDTNRYKINGKDYLSDFGLQKEYSANDYHNLPDSNEFDQVEPDF